ncbi:unnamed protein product [Closterium sp. NIES-65]|nr:unnamed protein product [Closterium sp. NIES-65]
MGAPKQKWTAEEEGALRAGVDKYGPGKWRAIQKDPALGPLLTHRSNVDLKVRVLLGCAPSAAVQVRSSRPECCCAVRDKWRNMTAAATGGSGGSASAVVPMPRVRAPREQQLPHPSLNSPPLQDKWRNMTAAATGGAGSSASAVVPVPRVRAPREQRAAAAAARAELAAVVAMEEEEDALLAAAAAGSDADVAEGADDGSGAGDADFAGGGGEAGVGAGESGSMGGAGGGTDGERGGEGVGGGSASSGRTGSRGGTGEEGTWTVVPSAAAGMGVPVTSNARLDEAIMMAVASLEGSQAAHGCSAAAVVKHIEDHHASSPNLRRLVPHRLRALSEEGCLVKVRAGVIEHHVASQRTSVPALSLPLIGTRGTSTTCLPCSHARNVRPPSLCPPPTGRVGSGSAAERVGEGRASGTAAEGRAGGAAAAATAAVAGVEHHLGMRSTAALHSSSPSAPTAAAAAAPVDRIAADLSQAHLSPLQTTHTPSHASAAAAAAASVAAAAASTGGAGPHAPTVGHFKKLRFPSQQSAEAGGASERDPGARDRTEKGRAGERVGEGAKEGKAVGAAQSAWVQELARKAAEAMAEAEAAVAEAEAAMREAEAMEAEAEAAEAAARELEGRRQAAAVSS